MGEFQIGIAESDSDRAAAFRLLCLALGCPVRD